MKMLNSNPGNWSDFVSEIRVAIAQDGVALVRDFVADEQNFLLARLSNDLGRVTVEGVNVEGNVLENGFIHRIEAKQSPLRDKYGFPILSTTSEPFACHTDHYFAPLPADVVLFQCAQEDPSGGESLIVHLRDVLPLLSKSTLGTLKERSFPAHFGKVCVIYERDGETRIRYNRLEVERASQVTGTQISGACKEALDELDRTMETVATRFHLNKNECLVINNHTVLHGRTALSTNSKRVLKRVRLHV